MLEGRTNLFTDYDVYHDESQIAGYWHGILLVPRDSRQRLLNLLATIRHNTERSDPISLKQLDTQSGRLYRCITCWLGVGVAALLQRLKGQPYSVPTGNAKQYSDYVPFTETIKARFVLFRVKTPMKALTLCADHVSRVERTFQIGFKGGLGFFSSGGEELCVRSLHFDGYKQYGRRIDLHQILRKMTDLREGIEIPHGVILDDRTSDHRRPDCQSYDDCQLLQLTDILVSGFRTVLGEATNEAHVFACKPLVELADRWNRGRYGFSQSRWHNGFCISEGSIADDGQWQFGPVEPAAPAPQPRLFD